MLWYVIAVTIWMFYTALITLALTPIWLVVGLILMVNPLGVMAVFFCIVAFALLTMFKG